jgi:hypothetical protein
MAQFMSLMSLTIVFPRVLLYLIFLNQNERQIKSLYGLFYGLSHLCKSRPDLKAKIHAKIYHQINVLLLGRYGLKQRTC